MISCGGAPDGGARAKMMAGLQIANLKDTERVLRPITEDGTDWRLPDWRREPV